jgi:hypothetical protein
MKRIFLLLIFCGTLLLAGCFETTQEINLNEDGSGTLSTTNDMSAIIGLVKQMGSKEADKVGDQVIDTTIALSTQIDSIKNLTSEEKELLKKGTMHVNMNLKDEKFSTNLRFPFKSPSEIKNYNQLTTKVMGQALKEQLGNSSIPGMEDMPSPTSIEDYFTTSFSKGLLIKTLNKEKYAGVQNDEYLKGMKESAGMGMPMTTTYIINLPRPAKKTEGKNVKLSDDKKKVTIETDIDDFFDDPSKLEFRIEY